MKVIVDNIEYKYSIHDLVKNLGITKFGVIKKLRRKNVKGVLLPAQRLFSQKDLDSLT